MKTVDFSSLTTEERERLLRFFRGAVVVYGAMGDALEAGDAERFVVAAAEQEPVDIHEGLQLMMRLMATGVSEDTVDKVKEQMTASINYDPSKAS